MLLQTKKVIFDDMSMLCFAVENNDSALRNELMSCGYDELFRHGECCHSSETYYVVVLEVMKVFYTQMSPFKTTQGTEIMNTAKDKERFLKRIHENN